jgi:hypothetical protein
VTSIDIRTHRVFQRHSDHPLLQELAAAQVGKWIVALPASLAAYCGCPQYSLAVVDDFGNLVRVPQ